MKKVFLMFVSLALAFSAGASVSISTDIAGKDATKFKVTVDGETADLTVKINGTECVFDGTTGAMKSGNPDLTDGVKSVQVKYAGRTAYDLAVTVGDATILVDGEAATVVDADCDGIWVEWKPTAPVVVVTVASLRGEYGANSVVYDSESNCLDDDAILESGKSYTVVYESDGMIYKEIINH